MKFATRDGTSAAWSCDGPFLHFGMMVLGDIFVFRTAGSVTLVPVTTAEQSRSFVLPGTIVSGGRNAMFSTVLGGSPATYHQI